MESLNGKQSEFVTVKEAAGILNCSERYIRNRIATGSLKAHRSGKRWMIYRASLEVGSESEWKPTGHEADSAQQEIHWLKQRIEQYEKEVSDMRKALDDASERHDTIVMQLTRQLEQGQRMIESHQTSWIRKLFTKKKPPG